MGYYTYYELYITKKDGKELNELEAMLVDKEVQKMNAFDYGNTRTGYTGENTWYDYNKDMCLLSSKFPDLLFSLHGDGEEREDMWIAWYLNGAYMHSSAKISYDDFDPDKLVREKFESLKYSYQ